MNRLENGLRRPRKTILGLDIAGRIESLGKGAPRFKPGDEVHGDISGTFALSHTQYRIAKIRHFEFMVQQAIKLKGKIPVPVPAHAESKITLGAVA